MIDYEKLKEAMKLAKKLPELYCVLIEVGANGVMFSIDILDGAPDSCLLYDVSLDELIVKIRELTKPEPRYKEGWFLRGTTTVVCKCALDCDGYAVHMDEDDDISAESWGKIMYPSRESLIKAQIEYWHGLLFPEEAKSSCCSVHAGTSEECGEFY